MAYRLFPLSFPGERFAISQYKTVTVKFQFIKGDIGLFLLFNTKDMNENGFIVDQQEYN